MCSHSVPAFFFRENDSKFKDKSESQQQTFAMDGLLGAGGLSAP